MKPFCQLRARRALTHIILQSYTVTPFFSENDFTYPTLYIQGIHSECNGSRRGERPSSLGQAAVGGQDPEAVAMVGIRYPNTLVGT